MDSYKEYGKYFAIDTLNGNNKFYISSYESDSRPTAHQIEVMSVCTHEQQYVATTDTCQSILPSKITIGLQDISSTMCLSNNEMIDYNRQVGESLCDFSCAARTFGKFCEP